MNTKRLPRGNEDSVAWLSPGDPLPPYCHYCTGNGHTYMECPERFEADIARARALHDEQHNAFNWLDCRREPCAALVARLAKGAR